MYRYFRPTILRYNNKGTIPITLWIIIYLNLLYTTTELQQFSFMHPSDFQFPFNSDKLSTMPKVPKTPMSGPTSKLTLLGSATGQKVTSQRTSRREQSENAKAKELERVNQKRTSDNISTGSGSQGHVPSRARTADSSSWSNVVSPNGKGDPNAKAIEGQDKSTASIVSTDKDKDKQDDMVLEKKNSAEKDKEKQNDKVLGEEEKKDQTETEMDINTKANANAAGKRSIEDLNRDLKKNVI
jgi:hypothetical protein